VVGQAPAGMSGDGALQLAAEDLHEALQDPLLGALGFLNEVMARYPDAISFAPGAPNPALLDELDVAAQLDRCVAHFARSRGLSARAARRMLFEYAPSRGLINDLLAEALRRDEGIDVPSDAIVVTVGAQEAMLLVVRALCRAPDDMLAVVSPCFVGIAGAARLLDVPVIAIDEGEHGVEVAAVEAACRRARAGGKRIRALYVAPDFSNPSGTVLGLDARRRLLELARREHLVLIEDCTYGFTAAPDAELPSLKALDATGHVVMLGTFAKLCLPGARVGFVVADQVVADGGGTRRLLADELATLKSVVTVNTSPIGQAVVGGMLLEAGCSLAALGRMRSRTYRHRLASLLDALDRHLLPGAAAVGVSWNRPAGGFFVRMRLPVPVDAALLERSASQFGVLWAPMSSFHVGGGGHDELRLSCSYLEPAEIEEGVGRLSRFLHATIRREDAHRDAPTGR
jgi:(S)-3,5-dihydroxyphenylglycine transaminase